jgi:hypothetical protein
MSTWINIVLYEIAWFSIVFGAASQQPLLGSSIAVLTILLHLYLCPKRSHEMLQIAVAVAVGTVIEGVNARLQIYPATSGVVFGGLAPWLIVIWASFATTLRYSLSWLSRQYGLSALLGAAAGPLAFWGGSRLGAVTLTDDTNLILLLAVEWAIALPLLVWTSDRIIGLDVVPKWRNVLAAVVGGIVLSGIPTAARSETPAASMQSSCVGASAQSLRGSGMYEHWNWIDVFSAELYDLPKNRVGSVLRAVPKCLVLQYHRNFSAEQFADVTWEGIENNVGAIRLAKLAPRIKRFNALYREVQKGDRYSLSFVPGVGTVFAFNGKTRGTIEGDDFAAALFAIWLGKHSMDNDLRSSLLGDNTQRNRSPS